MPGAPSSFFLLVAFLLLVVRPGAPAGVLAPSSDAKELRGEDTLGIHANPISTRV